MTIHFRTFRLASEIAMLTITPTLVQSAAVDDATKQPTKEQALAVLEEWKDTPRKTGEEIIMKYGAPDEMTATRMVWLNNGPWKWSILTNDPTPRHFPMEHEDVLEQAIAYEIPSDMVDELAHYDGSVLANRTQGELSARCDKEGANFLALNLAHDVATGAKSVEEARDYYAMAIEGFMKQNEMDPYMMELKFRQPSARAAIDTDEKVLN